MPEIEDRAETVLHDYVTTKVGLGIYDPITPRRSRIPVVSFEVELLEIEEDLTVHVAGPVVLRTENGDVGKYLRLSAILTPEGEIAENAAIRAAYIEVTSEENGACKETAALATE